MKGKAADAKLALNGQVEVLETKHEDLQSRMHQLRSGAADAWEEISAGLDRAMDEVQHALERAGDALEKSR